MSGATVVALAGLVALAAGVVAFERRPLDIRALALVAALGALAAASRVLIPIPSAKPVTALCIVAGAALGARAGAGVGVLAAVLSNAFLGQGPWTPWQALTWGAIGAAAALLAPALRRRPALVAFGLFAGLAYGRVLDLWMLAAYGPDLTWGSYLATSARALPFDVVHGLATALVLGVAGPALIRTLDRYGQRLEVRFVPHDAATSHTM